MCNGPIMAEFGDQALGDALLSLVRNIQDQIPPAEPLDNIPPQAMVDLLAMIRTLAITCDALLCATINRVPEVFAQPAGTWVSDLENELRPDNISVFPLDDVRELNMR